MDTFNKIDYSRVFLVVALVVLVVVVANSWNKGKALRGVKKELRENQEYINELARENVEYEAKLEELQDSIIKYETLYDRQVIVNEEQAKTFDRSIRRINTKIQGLTARYEAERQKLIQRIDSTLIFEK